MRRHVSAAVAVALVSALFALAPASAGDDALLWDASDKCSNAPDLDFAHDCYLHDSCFRYWVPLGEKTEEECDDEFLEDMLSTCRALYPVVHTLDPRARLRLEACAQTAFVYYRGAKFGSPRSEVPWDQIKESYQEGGPDHPHTVAPPAPAPAPEPDPSVTLRVGGDAQGQARCSTPPCRFLAVSLEGFESGFHTVECWSTRSATAYKRLATSVWPMTRRCYYGYPGERVWVVVDGVRSNTITWPTAEQAPPIFRADGSRVDDWPELLGDPPHWHHGNAGHGYGPNNFRYTHAALGDSLGSYAVWDLGTVAAGRYRINAYIPSNQATANTEYEIYVNGRLFAVRRINQYYKTGFELLAELGLPAGRITIRADDNDASPSWRDVGYFESSLAADAIELIPQ